MNIQQQALQPGAAVRILPAGKFKANDSRPQAANGWFIDAVIARDVVALADSHQDSFVIDYEHQSLKGKEAPAAGWFKRLEWREGDGLFMTDITWTARAKAMISALEYRYVSPVFLFNNQTGGVEKIVSVALTNTPALTGLTDLAVASINQSGLSAHIHFEPFHCEAVAQLKAQQSAEYFKRVFGVDPPLSRIPQTAPGVSLASAIAQCSDKDQESLNQNFAYLLRR